MHMENTKCVQITKCFFQFISGANAYLGQL